MGEAKRTGCGKLAKLRPEMVRDGSIRSDCYLYEKWWATAVSELVIQLRFESGTNHGQVKQPDRESQVDVRGALLRRNIRVSRPLLNNDVETRDTGYRQTLADDSQ